MSFKVKILFLLLVLFIPFRVIYADDLQNIDYGTVLFIGDSYGTGYNSDIRADDRANSWINQAIRKMGLENSVSKPYGGTGICKVQDEKNFETLMTEAYGSISDKSIVRWVVVAGGYNDKHYSLDELVECGESFVEKARSYFPNAQIAIGMVGWHNTYVEYQEKLGTVLAAYKKIALDNNVLYIDGIENILRGKTEFFTVDMVHPNAIGEGYIADAIVSFLYKNTCNVIYHKNTLDDDEKESRIYVAGLLNQKMADGIFNRDEYVFAGWGSDSNTVIYRAGDSVSDDFIRNNKVVNVNAIWKNSKINISFDMRGGSGNFSSVIVDYGKCINISKDIPVRDSYDFKGWSIGLESNNKIYLAGDEFCPEDDSVLYGVWEKKSIDVNPKTGMFIIFVVVGLLVLSFSIVIILKNKMNRVEY